MDENKEINENIIEKEDEITQEDLDNEVDVKIDTNKKSIGFKDTLISTIIDMIVSGAISVAVLFIGDLILRFAFGYYIVEKIQMTFIIYLIVSLLYRSIMEGCKGTIGQKYLKAELTKID